MVWGLFPADPLSGEEKYYIFGKGTYKVGRKGCDVTSKDMGVSRVHAEIDVEAMVSLYPVKNKTSDINTKVWIRDRSKYGTFISRADCSKEKVHECCGKETILKDGDLVSFGTGNAKFRFSFVPFIFYSCNSGASQVSSLIGERVLSIGGYVTHKWTDECTHVMVDEFSPFSDDLIGAIVSKKPFVLHKWLEVLVKSRICNEIPSCSLYVPTLTLEATSVAVADIRSRENCLKDYSFLLEPAHVYKYGSRLSSILEVGGATACPVEAFDSVTQGTEDGEGRQVVHVIPSRPTSHPCQRSSLVQINEMDLIQAVISGYLDPSILISPSIAISSSCSTDETIVADSDAETETGTATSGQVNAKVEAYESVVKYEGEVEILGDHAAPTENIKTINNKLEENERKGIKGKEDDGHPEYESKVETSPHHKDDQALSFVNIAVVTGKMDDGPESGNSEILYSQALIVRNSSLTKPSNIQPDDGKAVNFKRFRKTSTQSGDSFFNFVPFAKHAYMESDFESKEVVKSVEEEKRRKKMEAIAEDLFNGEKGKRRGVAGSLKSLLSHHSYGQSSSVL